MTNAVARTDRRRWVEHALATRTSVGHIARRGAERFSVSERTIERDINQVLQTWQHTYSEQDLSERLALSRETASREVARLQGLIQSADSISDNVALSTALYRWEQHLARLDGIFIGRADMFPNLGTQIELVLEVPSVEMFAMGITSTGSLPDAGDNGAG